MVSKKQEGWIDIHNDDLMVKYGFRCPVSAPRDPSVWSRTPNERRILKYAKRGKSTHFNSCPRKISSVRDNLIIYLKKNNKYPKTTYSIECWLHEIPTIISRYRISTKDGDETAVLKYSYNGMTYAANELPYFA